LRFQERNAAVIKGFKNFLLRGDVIVLAIGLTVALAFSTLVKAFTDSVINPLISRAQGGHSVGLGVQLGQSGNSATFVNLGLFISAIIYFLIFMTVLYLAVVLPYKHVSARQGKIVFGDAPPTKTCPACLSDDLPVAASKCKYCGSDQPVATVA
jgi:large conductance mechanosensitive channel